MGGEKGRHVGSKASCSLLAPRRRGLFANAPSPGGEHSGREVEGGSKPGPFVRLLLEKSLRFAHRSQCSFFS